MPLPQGGDVDLDDVEAVVEVLAELPSSSFFFRSRWVAATIRTSTLKVWFPPTRSNSRSSRKRSSLTWTVGEMSPISSRKSVPPSAISKRPARAVDGAGEGALLVAEQLALEQGLGQRGAGDLDEWLVLARAVLVKSLGE